MLEAVGHEYLPAYFHHCDRLLSLRGVLVVQARREKPENRGSACEPDDNAEPNPRQ